MPFQYFRDQNPSKSLQSRRTNCDLLFRRGSHLETSKPWILQKTFSTIDKTYQHRPLSELRIARISVGREEWRINDVERKFWVDQLHEAPQIKHNRNCSVEWVHHHNWDGREGSVFGEEHSWGEKKAWVGVSVVLGRGIWQPIVCVIHEVLHNQHGNLRVDWK